MKSILDKTLAECVEENPNITIRDLFKQYESEIAENDRVRNDATQHAKELTLEECVVDTLREIGVPYHVKGYRYITRALILTIEDPEKFRKITKTLYPTIAKEYKISSSRVEKSIRDAIILAWKRGETEVFCRYFGHTIKDSQGKPSNAEFIWMVANTLQIKLKKEGKII